jgi:hypothetical protein
VVCGAKRIARASRDARSEVSQMSGVADPAVQGQPKERSKRTYFTDPGLARRLDELNAGRVDGMLAARRDNILYDSETAKSTNYYAEDQRERVHEHATVVRVHIESWTEFVIRPVGAADEVWAILWLINMPEWQWSNASSVARDLLAFAVGEAHAISVPVRHGRLLWIPSLTAVRGLITIGEANHVRIQWGPPSRPPATGGMFGRPS